jgi:hypothetical protein
MAQQDDREYEETVDPKNPPNSVLRPEVRGATISTFLGGIVVFFLVIGAALIYWKTSGRNIDPDPGQRDRESEYIGTTGSPDPRPGNTSDELKFRGSEGLDTQPIDELGDVLDTPPSSVIGKRVDLHNISVATADPGVFWVHDGNDKVEVIAPADAPAVRAGQAIDLIGIAESDDHGGVRIRATRVATR